MLKALNLSHFRSSEQSSELNSFHANHETVEALTDFIFLGFKITADSDCSHEIKRCLLLRRKAMTNLDSVLKSRDITLPSKVWRVKAVVFLAVMYGHESWTIKKVECWRTDALGLWCWRTLESPLNCKEITAINPRNQLWIFTGRDWFWSSNTLATWCKDPNDWKRPWGGQKEKGQREWDGWMASTTQWRKSEQTLGDSGGQRGLATAVHGVAESAWVTKQ